MTNSRRVCHQPVNEKLIHLQEFDNLIEFPVDLFQLFAGSSGAFPWLKAAFGSASGFVAVP
jgi:hypothetical protein